MTFWIDADSCAARARELASRRAARLGAACILVACRPVRATDGAEVRVVPEGQDAADNAILDALAGGDLVVTRDLRLAQRVLEKDAWAMNDRGDIWTPDTLRERLSLAEFAKVLYDSGIASRGANTYGQKDADSFARGLDQWLVKVSRKPSSAGEERRP